MMTRKEILSIEKHCAEHKVSHKKRETILAEGVADRIIGLYTMGNSTR